MESDVTSPTQSVFTTNHNNINVGNNTTDNSSFDESLNETTPGNAGNILDCTKFDESYDPIMSLISFALFILGVLYCAFGFRCYKTILFLTGFLFGLVIVFLICQEEDLLPQYGNIGISTLCGLLYGLICLLVPYVGFFTVGFNGGLLLGVVCMVFFPGTYSIWISVIFLMGIGLFGAIANVCFPSLSKVTTSLIGAAALSASLDYFIERFKMTNWIWAHVKGREEVQFCWYSWFLLALWPTLFIMGMFIQHFLTAKGFTVHTYPYKKRELPRRRLTREERAVAKQAKYRYLYQVRTAGGDILSQQYIQSIQNKGQPVDTLSTHMSTLQAQEETQIMDEE